MRIHLRVTLAALFLAALPGLALGAQRREVKKTVDFDPGGQLTLETNRGSIHLDSWDQKRIKIVARIEAPEGIDAEYARRIVEAARVELQGDSRAFTIRSNYDDVPYREEHKGSRSRTVPHIHYRIQAPRKLNLRVEDSRSHIDISGFEGEVEVEAHRGSLDVRDLSGSLRLVTSRGPFEARDLSGTLHLEAHRGTFSARNLTGSIFLDVSRGKAALSEIRGALEVKASRADVTLDAIQIEGDSRVENYRGTIELRLPESVGLSLRTEIGERGEFLSDREILMQRIRGRNFEGTINGGGPELCVKIDRGKIILKR